MLGLLTSSLFAACTTPTEAPLWTAPVAGELVWQWRSGPELRAGETVRMRAAAPWLSLAFDPEPQANRVADPLEPGKDLVWVPVERWERTAGGLVGRARYAGRPITVTVAFAGAVTRVWTLELTLVAPATVELVRFAFTRHADEGLWGGGELFGSANLMGTRIPLFFTVSFEKASGINEYHYPVPFFYSSRGWGLFAEQLEPGAVDAREPDHWTLTFSRPERLRLHLFAETEPWSPYADYLAIVGPPRLPPDWALAPMQWRNVLNGWDELYADLAAMRREELPVSTIWIDNPWQTGYNTFDFDPKRFPDPASHIAAIKAKGVKLLLWSTPHLNKVDRTDRIDPTTAPTRALFERAAANGWLVTDDTGAVQVIPWQEGEAGLIDFTHPDAFAFWVERIDRVVRLGIDGFKLDFGEEVIPFFPGGGVIPFRFYDGSDQHTMHGLSQNLYHLAYAEALLARGKEVFLLTRGGTWGDHRITTAVWPGDLDNDFRRAEDTEVGGLPAAINAAISLSISGFPSFGSDIGGYRGGTPSKEALLRWAQFQSVLPIMQLGGAGNHRPWDMSVFDAETLAIYRVYAQLHMQLFPYLKAALARAHREPLVRPVGLVWPDDPDAVAMPYEFLVGDDLLVAPIAEGGSRREVYVPPGTWVNWFDPNDRIEGPKVIEATIPLDRLWLYVRAGARIPTLPPGVDTLVPVSDPDEADVVYWDPAVTDYTWRTF